MLASVGVGWLWLLAAAALVLLCSAMAIWVPTRRFRLVNPFIWIAYGAGLGITGWAQGWPPATTLVYYSFSLIGLTIGLFPSRKLFTASARENEGAAATVIPRQHVVFSVVVVILMVVAATALLPVQ
ncbi:hypothetical protein ACIQM4_28040 [Streptomyces sp. NPDC091272]|uniref:hypothetical protein n=1 Tax=Streptomyces sp. NPDC091272 TaxID=3365981 RepID=UPI00381F091D